jgi:hypothetical protein
MLKTKYYIIPLLVIAACLAPGARAFAWTDAVHRKTALLAVDYFPPAIRDMINANKKAYLEGVSTEPELYDKVLDEKSDFSVELLRVRGFERYVYHLQRLKFFFDKKSNPAAVVNELGMFARSAQDLMEPFPADNSFRQLEIAGDRVFFINDFDTYFKNFHFMYDGSQLIKDLPKRIDTDLDLSGTKGLLIYKGYKKGIGYRAIEGDAQAVMNRTLNLLVDQLYTMYESRKGGQQPPFEPSQYLGLDRYRKKGSIKEMKIKGPKAPDAPGGPKSPEIKKKNDNQTDDTAEEKEE